MMGELERQVPDLNGDLVLRLPGTTERIRHAGVLAHRGRITPSEAVSECHDGPGSLHRHHVRVWDRVSDEAHELAEREGIRTLSPCIDDRPTNVLLLEPDHEIGCF